MNIDDVVDWLKRWEGDIPHLDRCTGGRVTVGIGHAIASPNDAVSLLFIDGTGARPPEQDIRDGFSRVLNAPLPSNTPASSFKQFTAFTMDAANRDALARSDIGRFATRIEKAYLDFPSWPAPAQTAVIDMVFNVGLAGFGKFKKLIAAIRARDWEQAAVECHRRGIGDDRNAATAALFRSCA